MELDREEILQILRRVVLSPPNDAVALALAQNKKGVSKLDLWGVSEFKQGKDGNIEIKFADRVKAISLLLEQMNGGQDGLKALLEALEE